ncbi:export ABC transporter ATP-binding protein [Bacillus pseudomycoides]|uniref:Export ABC transporter ATP-binding protein n=1 Tax=Bacillus pseudomycoides TaxID=64104 RepID=A0AA91VFR9_9BACI|nr:MULTISPECIES: ABC transporter ATP-binding protein [Bacillus]PEB51966.1 export ABC transporter ATP-binding protein [Bacillus sp. AFS098217]PED83345.1 export ABC transporter ATP-binding protein [Bacillus pseudomycoides]PEU12675.1 export ABC transporter ATP-binding protein [Bacillus sp. AFS019443]PEU19083.1 export ABC transporter ATP-binding protein [Bacillus sp. AFS014408]PFW58315.1 export ABC transporter ATP-binding protein [Bacillus sp. AFS075034]
MLVVDHITKSFGKKEVVKNVSFEVKKGETFGLLGPNGAGKSTTISMICGLIPYDGGDIKVGGKSVKEYPLDAKRKIGIVPQDIALYPTLSAKENLIFWGKMYGLSGAIAKKRADEVLAYVGLQDRAKDKIETFSGGMKRRINIGAALMHEPELLIMDEPTVGIDPQSRNHILETVKGLNEKGMTVIYTSHYMEEVEYLCERIAIVDHGKVIALGTKTELCNRLADGFMVKLQLNRYSEELLQKIKGIPTVERIIIDEDTNTLDIGLKNGEAIGMVVSVVVENYVQILKLEVQEPNLEALFLQLTGRSLRD